MSSEVSHSVVPPLLGLSQPTSPLPLPRDSVEGQRGPLHGAPPQPSREGHEEPVPDRGADGDATRNAKLARCASMRPGRGTAPQLKGAEPTCVSAEPASVRVIAVMGTGRARARGGKVAAEVEVRVAELRAGPCAATFADWRELLASASHDTSASGGQARRAGWGA